MGIEDTGEYETVYNCRVAEWHTYFVGCDDGGVWAHNAYRGLVESEEEKAFAEGLENRAKAVNVPVKADDTGYDLNPAVVIGHPAVPEVVGEGRARTGRMETTYTDWSKSLFNGAIEGAKKILKALETWVFCPRPTHTPKGKHS